MGRKLALFTNTDNGFEIKPGIEGRLFGLKTE